MMIEDPKAPKVFLLEVVHGNVVHDVESALVLNVNVALLIQSVVVVVVLDLGKLHKLGLGNSKNRFIEYSSIRLTRKNQAST